MTGVLEYIDDYAKDKKKSNIQLNRMGEGDCLHVSMTRELFIYDKTRKVCFYEFFL